MIIIDASHSGQQKALSCSAVVSAGHVDIGSVVASLAANNSRARAKFAFRLTLAMPDTSGSVGCDRSCSRSAHAHKVHNVADDRSAFECDISR